MKKSLYLILILISFVNLVTAQNTNIKFKRYTIDDGLSQSRVYDILQDRLGYIWIATEGGLNKFDGYEFHNFKVDRTNPNLLYNSDVRTLFEDSKGRLWVGTAGDGVVQYYNRERKNFTSYFLFPDNPERAKSQHIRNIGEDKDGNIWVATHPGGLYKFNPDYPELEVQEVLISNPNTPQQSRFSGLGVIYKDSNDYIWIGGTGLHLYDQENNKFISFFHDPEDENSIIHNFVSDIIEDSNGILWVLTNNGLNGLQLDSIDNIINKKNVSFIKILAGEDEGSSLGHREVVSIAEDNNKNLWIGAFDGLYKLNLRSLYDNNNKITTSHLDITHFIHNPADEESLNFNNVRTTYCDNNGIVWVGTSAGLNQSKNEKFIHYHQKGNKGLSNNKIEAIFEDSNNNLWVCNVKGVDILNKNKREFTHVLPGPVLTACESKNGMIYFGTWLSGLIEFNPKTRNYKNYNPNSDNQNSVSDNHIFSLIEDSKENLWIGTWGGGLNLYNRETNKFIHYKYEEGNNENICSNCISYLFEDSRKNLWIGTLSGLCLLTDKEKGEFKVFRSNPYDNTALQHNHIIYIQESKNGQLWIGTMDGLHEFNYLDSTFICYTTEDGLPDNRIMGILEDEHSNLWISTKNGLAKFTIPMPDNYVIENINQLITTFDIDDGLQSKEFVQNSCFKGNDGKLYFGGINGFNVVNPDNLEENTLPPLVYITSFKLFNKEVLVGEAVNNQIILNEAISETDQIELSYKNNVFTFGFTALNYNAPEQTKYAYIMEGFDKEWNYVENQRIASYTNLNHGEYIFKVKAANNDGIWNEEGQSIKLIITPPFWKTWWFRTLLFIFLALTTFTIIEIRLYSIKQQKKVLEIKVQERTVKIVKQKEEIEEQSQKISKMNLLLKKHNIELEENVHHLEEARVMQKLLSFEEYKKLFPSEYDCLKMLENLKWQNGYKCRKCDSKVYSKDDETLARRCKHCNYKESVTSWTIFHRLRFPLHKALYILILTNTGRQLNISKISETLGLRMKTCWDFHNKVKEVKNTKKRNTSKQKEAWKDIILLTKKDSSKR